nr:carboxypeptidase regulatory-like domain-containing protein [Nicoletella semolina]
MAHSLHLFAQYDGNAIVGKAYYSDMTPAAQTYIRAYLQAADESQVEIIEGKTDTLGYFSLPALPPSALGNRRYTVVIEGMEGHRATTLAYHLTASSEVSSQGELLLIREEIAQLRDKIYLRDILGGIGYILGFFGVWALLQKKLRQKQKRFDDKSPQPFNKDKY